MRNKTDKILLSVLWLLAVTLGACFWFNSMYGFNLFSNAHWKYLATLQAGQASIQSGFYISLIAFTAIALIGLYILVRPKFRKIKLSPSVPAKPTQGTTPTPSLAQSPNVPLPSGLTRPMRPNVARPSSLDVATPPTAPVSTPQSSSPTITPPSTPAQSTTDYPQIRDIFSNAGYVVKNAPPRIERTPIALLAIGTGEQLWIGGVGITTSDLTRAMDKLNQVFSDTLDDIYINVNGFIVASPDAATNDTNILTFDGMSDLGNYISSHPNPAPDDDERENFDAYSEYIDTVTEYIGKV